MTKITAKHRTQNQHKDWAARRLFHWFANPN
jgi:hypothetical protein